jgi:hypothetical protein
MRREAGATVIPKIEGDKIVPAYAAKELRSNRT